MVKRVFIVRHGLTDFNAEGRWQGFMPTSLNEIGHEQAEKLAQYLKDKPIEMIISSDLKRSMQTAQPTANLLNLEIETDERLREINLGDFQGFTSEEIQAKFPQMWRTWRENYLTFVIPNGESREMVKDRVYSAWQNRIDTATEETILFVSHGGTIRMLMRGLFGEGEWMHADFTNTSITIVEKHENGWKVVDLAITPHLNT